MTKFILVRHGKPIYDEVLKAGFTGHGIAFAPLSQEGIEEVEKTSKNSIFMNSDILISSPYTRTMQTASIFSSRYNLPINVEILLHEWIPDLDNKYNTVSEFTRNIHIAKEEYQKGLNDPNFHYNEKIESLVHVRERALSVLSKYFDYDKVIVITHGLLINTLFDEDIRLKTGDYFIVDSDYLIKRFNLDKNKEKVLK